MTIAKGTLTPNPRMQRTHSAPLMRQPFGGRTTIVGALFSILAGLVGCETINGKTYWVFAAPPFVVTSACEQSDSTSKWTTLVEVRDQKGEAVPGATIRFTNLGGEASVQEFSDSSGRAKARLDPGTWRVETSLAGFRPARYILNLGVKQICTVNFVIRVDPNAPTVTVS
jgi:Carboxypeptidase regulatory-like domain